MPYAGLGSRGPLKSAPDQTGFNPGNWTTAFTADILDIGVAWAEVYHAVVESVPAGAQASIRIGIKPYSFTNPVTGAEWDPAQPLLLSRGQDIYFYWSIPAAGVAPAVTLWLRFDPSLPGNRS